MKNLDFNKKVNLLVAFLSIVVIGFGYFTFKNIPIAYAEDEEDMLDETYGEIETKIEYPVVKKEVNCKNFTVGVDDNYYTGIHNSVNSNLNIILYNAKSNCEDGTSFVAFCLDPSRSGPNRNTGPATINYKLDREVLNKDEDSAKVYNYDRAAAYIYQNSYPNKKGSGDRDRVIANIAMRFLTFHVGFDKHNGGHLDNYLGFKYTTQYIDSGNDKKCEKVAIDNTGRDCKDYVFQPDSNGIYSEAVKLYKEALEVYAGNRDIWEQDLKFKETVDVEKTTVESTGSFKKYIHGEITGLDAFDGGDASKSYVKNLRVTCDNDKITCKVLNGKKQHVGAEDLLNKKKYNDGFEYIVEMSGDVANLSGKEVNIKVEVDYYDSRDYTNGFVTDAGSTYQRMTLFAGETKRTMSQEFKVSFCDFDASDIKDDENLENFFYNYCNQQCLKSPKLNPESPQFDEGEFKSAGCCAEVDPTSAIYDRYCGIDCVRYYFPSVCSNGTVNAYVIEGIDKDTQKYNYDKCVIDKDKRVPAEAPRKDVANNSLKMTNQNGLELNNNYYCSVACIESWNFTLPGSVHEVRAGSYFMLLTKLEGTRTCVTSDIKYGSQKNPDQYKSGYFLYDLDAVNEDIVRQFDTWQAAKKSLEQIDSSTKHYMSDSGSYCDSEEPIYSPNDPDMIVDWKCNHWATMSANWIEVYPNDKSITLYEYRSKKSGYNYEYGEGVVNSMSKTLKNNGFANMGSKYGYGGVTCRDTNRNGIADHCDKEEFNYNIDPAYEALVTARDNAIRIYNDDLNERDKMIYHIKSCSAWENNFNFDPVVSYAYEEDYYMNNMIKNENYFVSTGDSSSDYKSVYCQGSYADDESYNCSGASNSQFDYNKSNVKCSDGGSCTKENITVPKNQNIKIDVSNSALYKPRTVFYVLHDSGEIDQDNSHGYDYGTEPSNPSGRFETTKIGRVFPVRLTTAKGVYNYKLVFNRIGQFSDDNSFESNLGRLLNYKNGSDGNKPVVTVDESVHRPNKLFTDRKDVYSAIGLKPTYICTYEIYEDVCKCCAGEELEIIGPPKPPNSMVVDSNGYLTFYYRSVSLNDLFPNDGSADRTVGSNWTDDKGQQVYNSISALGDFAYQEPEYSVILTPNAGSNVREYNRNQESSGGFDDFTLTCNEYGYNCTSSFLDNLNQITGEQTLNVRNSTGFVNYDGFDFATLEANGFEGMVATGVGPSMK